MKRDKYCEYCGGELIPGHRSFGICAWCIKKISDSQKKTLEKTAPRYFSTDKDKFNEEIDYG